MVCVYIYVYHLHVCMLHACSTCKGIRTTEQYSSTTVYYSNINQPRLPGEDFSSVRRPRLPDGFPRLRDELDFLVFVNRVPDELVFLAQKTSFQTGPKT